MKTKSSFPFVFLLALLFAVAASLAFRGLVLGDTTQWLPLVVAIVAGIGLILHVWRLSGGGRDNGPQGALGDQFATQTRRTSFLPYVTILFVIAAVIATWWISYGEPSSFFASHGNPIPPR